jgi:DNA modification methylase
MQDRGWIVRSRIAWCKTSAMPESVRDRPTSAWEHLWMFSKSARYFYDADAVAQPSKSTAPSGNGYARPERLSVDGVHQGQSAPWQPTPTSALRNFWLLGPEPSRLNHYAGFPTEIPKRCILAGSRRGDTVLDPFLGSGTTALVADRLGRNAVGIELNPTYAAMARDRIANDAPMVSEPVEVVGGDQLDLFGEAV